MRLIDVDEIIKQLDPNTWQGEMMIAIVNGLPTAYDADKVIERLKKHWCKDCRKQEMCKDCHIKEFVLDIVKGGGQG